jgi:acetyltransferase
VTPFAPATIAARDGRRAVVRPVRPADAPLVQQFVRELSPQSRRNRFFAPVRELSPVQLERMTRFDGATGFGLVALAGADGGQIVGIAQHAVCEPPFAELAVVVADDWQRQGLGERLVALLLAHAARTGIAAIQGVIMAANRPMLALAAKLGFVFEDAADPALVRVEKSLDRVHCIAAAPAGPLFIRI